MARAARVLLGIACPPAHCALRRRWGGAVLTGLLWLIALWLGLAFLQTAHNGIFPALSGLVWLLAAGLALAEGRRLRFAMYVLVIFVGLAALLITLYQDVGLKARLAADHGTAAALRAAIATYYARHGGFPPDAATAEKLLREGELWQCVGQGWTYDPATGRAVLRVNDLRACLGLGP